jgi:hypothetical protein
MVEARFGPSHWSAASPVKTIETSLQLRRSTSHVAHQPDWDELHEYEVRPRNHVLTLFDSKQCFKKHRGAYIEVRDQERRYELQRIFILLDRY